MQATNPVSVGTVFPHDLASYWAKQRPETQAAVDAYLQTTAIQEHHDVLENAVRYSATFLDSTSDLLRLRVPVKPNTVLGIIPGEIHATPHNPIPGYHVYRIKPLPKAAVTVSAYLYVALSKAVPLSCITDSRRRRRELRSNWIHIVPGMLLGVPRLLAVTESSGRVGDVVTAQDREHLRSMGHVWGFRMPYKPRDRKPPRPAPEGEPAAKRMRPNPPALLVDLTRPEPSPPPAIPALWPRAPAASSDETEASTASESRAAWHLRELNALLEAYGIPASVVRQLQGWGTVSIYALEHAIPFIEADIGPALAAALKADAERYRKVYPPPKKGDA